jgi:hypothetical protein
VEQIMVLGYQVGGILVKNLKVKGLLTRMNRNQFTPIIPPNSKKYHFSI